MESSKDILGFCQVKSIISVANSGDLPKNIDMLLDPSDTSVAQRVMMHPLMYLFDAFHDMCDIWAGVHF